MFSILPCLATIILWIQILNASQASEGPVLFGSGSTHLGLVGLLTQIAAVHVPLSPYIVPTCPILWNMTSHCSDMWTMRCIYLYSFGGCWPVDIPTSIHRQQLCHDPADTAVHSHHFHWNNHSSHLHTKHSAIIALNCITTVQTDIHNLYFTE